LLDFEDIDRRKNMNIIRGVLAVVLGIVACMFAKMAVMKFGPSIFPFPDGMNPNNFEDWKTFAPVLQAKHLVTPFLDHALGSFFGGLVAALIAANRKIVFAIAIGILHLVGGIAAAFMIPAPVWFIALDLIVAYIPMAYLGGLISGKGK
jgi:hypothetical protein